MEVKALTLKDRVIFERFFPPDSRLAVYSFPSVYIWKSLYSIFWGICDGKLCVFFRDRTGCFLYLPPLGSGDKEKAVRCAFRVMDRFNSQPQISRIENIDERETGFYRDIGMNIRQKSADYIYRTQDLIGLSGNRYKSKRASLNYFMKHYRFDYAAFSPRDKNECLKLYHDWAGQRLSKEREPFYRWMIEDSGKCFRLCLEDYRALKIIGRVVRVNGGIRAATFGYPLTKDTFCILFEFADLSFKGIGQFIFQKMSSDCSGFTYINAMDDSGLENLSRVKLSYRPVRLVRSYIAERKT